jgi:CheY-like chemotaxis protein
MIQLRVLVVDDHGPSRLLLRRLLERKGHLVEEADDGLDGVRKALAWKPDVAVVDLDMPVVDGYGVAMRLRQALGQGIRLIALTPNYSSPSPQGGRPGASRPLGTPLRPGPAPEAHRPLTPTGGRHRNGLSDGSVRRLGNGIRDRGTQARAHPAIPVQVRPA